MDELLDFFSKAPEQNDLLSFSSNPFDEVDENLNSANDSSNVLDTILKHGQILRIRPDPGYYKDYRATYTSNGNVIFENKEIDFLQFLRDSRNMFKILYDSGNIPQTRKTSNPLKYIEAFVDNEWQFLSKIINPKTYIEYSTTAYGCYMTDVTYLYYYTIAGGFNLEKLRKLRNSRHIFKNKWICLPTEWLTAYEQRISDLFTKEEAVSTVPIITVEFVQSVMNDGT